MSLKKFITAEWRKLIMANYEIDPGILKKYIPSKTELDTYNNKHYVSLVGFMFLNTKLKGVSIPFHSNFPEVNLRFYVKHKAGNDWKRGVVFINEFVPKPAITFVANSLFKEKYVTYPMKHKWELTDRNLIGYHWKKNNKWNNLEVTASLDSHELRPGSKEEFITEHYWGYSSVDQNRTNEYQVEHPRWNIYPVENYTIGCDFAELYGNEFEFLNKSQPGSIFLAEGSAVSIYSKKVL
jgi:uncharacterized protein